MAEEKKVQKDRGRWFREMKSELKKVVWPSPQKVAKNTATVFLCTAVIGACIWIFDGVAGLFVKTLLNIFA
ncbi:MAG: preprotein translocase subunit SecE [Oscillospiraceae bacterium]|nr:preprotein translocase subunit SecE [Oscillospiraceae bacterium]